ncbi:MAG: MFS transporter, partial [Clostridia bacterium]|nr:MFS transporter [Clostridia bacterium]
SKWGRRMPFIVVGSVLGAVSFMLVNFAHNQHNLVLMLVTTAFVLLCMCSYRTPAVSLMPDVTPKPIRSSGNAVINIMGTIGGVISLVLMTFLNKFKTDAITGEKFLDGNNWALICIICGMMILTTVVMIIKIKENKFVDECQAKMKELGLAEEVSDDEPKKKVSIKNVLGTLTKPELKSLIFILASVFLWFFAYNALTTHFSSFALDVLKNEGFTLPLLIANAAAFIMYVPSSLIGKKIGRKKTIILGIGMIILGLAFSSVFLIANVDPSILQIAMYPTFILVGGGWATINVHSYIMCVELSSEKTTGAYTGLYYAFSMTAQILTPILAGLVMDHIGKRFLVPYSLIFACLALTTMVFVRHGNAIEVKNNASDDAQSEKIAQEEENNDEE